MYALMFLIATAATAFSAPATPLPAGSGNCGPLGGNGELIDSGYVYYLCQDGKLYPKGCVSRENKRVDVGQTVDYRQARLSCDMKGQLPALTLKSCVHQGAERQLDTEFTVGAVAFACVKNGDDAKVTAVGCSDQGGKTVKFNDKVTKEDGVYLCVGSPAGTAQLVKAGCVKDGKQYNLGDSFDIADTWYNCTRTGPRAMGCVSVGKRLNDGDRYFDNDVIYECFIENDKKDVRVAGCVQHDGANTVERRLNCYWVEGPEPLQYEWTCKHNAEKNTAEKKQVRCQYRVSKGVYTIEPGCYRTIDKAVFGCVRDGDKLNLQSFQGDDSVKAATAAGLSMC